VILPLCAVVEQTQGSWVFRGAIEEQRSLQERLLLFFGVSRPCPAGLLVVAAASQAGVTGRLALALIPLHR
jgi:hypothetical protein